MTKGELTRVRILEAATALFYAKGFEDVALAEIAKKARLTQPALYLYFKNKLLILASCGMMAAEQGRVFIASKINPQSSPDSQLRSYIAANIEWFAKNRPQAHALQSVYYFSKVSPVMDQLRGQIENTGVERFAALIQQGSHAGLWKGERRQENARMIHSLMVGEIFKGFYEPNAMTTQKRTEELIRCATALLKS